MDIFGNFGSLPGDNKKRVASRGEEIDFSYSDVTTEPITRIEERGRNLPIFAVKGGILLLFCALVLKLFFMQVVYGSFSQDKATENSIKPRVIDAPRGIITDTDGGWLARNDPEFALAVYPCDLPKKKSEREDAYQKISQISGLSLDDIRTQSEKDGLLSLYAVYLRENIPHDEALVLQKKTAEIPGLVVAKRSKREYATIPGLAHILGYTGMVSEDDLKKNPDEYFLSDKIGKVGLEASYEDDLRGKHGIEEVEKDSKGNVVRVLVQEQNQQPVSGDNLTLYLNRGLQEEAARSLKANIDKAREDTGDEFVKSGVAIVMDVNSGGVLAMVSLPDYNNNLFATKISSQDYQNLINDKSNPMLNRAIAGVYPPGSVSKIILAAAGLDAGIISSSTSIETPQEIKIGDYSFPDWKYHTGVTNVVRAIAESNNIFFYALGGGYDKIKGLGIAAINKYWKLFGLGNKTGIDLPGESSGFLPSADWKKKAKNEQWYLGDTYHVSIGQGDLLVTPIQMLRATVSIANGGKLLQPQLVKKIVGHDGSVKKEIGPRVEDENIVSGDVIKAVRVGMRATITDGSARSVFTPDFPVQVAGKTGTAQFSNNQKTHAWFECFAPYENPEVAVLVLVEGGGEGYTVAAPVAKDILQYYFQKK